MFLMQIKYSKSVYSFEKAKGVYVYNKDLDNIEKIVIDICEYLSSTGLVEFQITGFGLNWPVDVLCDLATVVSQIPIAIKELNNKKNVDIELFEQGIERIVSFYPVGDEVRVECKNIISEDIGAKTECLPLTEIIQMLIIFHETFLDLANILCPSITSNEIFEDWVNKIKKMKNVRGKE